MDDRELEEIRRYVDRLCTEYAHRDAHQLLAECRQLLSQVEDVLRHRQCEPSSREVRRQQGWLHLLISCLHWDSGELEPARTTRDYALAIGQDLDDCEISAWAAEISAWMALTRGDWESAIRAADVGLSETIEHAVSAQLYAQQAKAWSRIGAEAKAEDALMNARHLMSQIVAPANPNNHFSVDLGKINFLAMDCYRQLKIDDLAVSAAMQVHQDYIGSDSEVSRPMRAAEASLTLAIVRARHGDVETALTLAETALQMERVSMPSLDLVGKELVQELQRCDPVGHRSRLVIERLQLVGGGAPESPSGKRASVPPLGRSIPSHGETFKV